jgi:hypothetical protein
LAIRKSNVSPAGAEFTSGIIAIELIVKRRSGEERRISVFFGVGFSAGVNPPTVANDKHHRTRHLSIVTEIAARSKRSATQSMRDSRIARVIGLG